MNKFFNFKHLKGDLTGGISSFTAMLPTAIACGILAFANSNDPGAMGVGALAGLTGAVILGLVSALLGSGSSAVNGPTGIMAIIAAVSAGSIYQSGGSIESAIAVLVLAFVFCGIFQIIFGLLKAGSVLNRIPYPVISGFMSGIGILIILTQIFPLLGLNARPDTFSMLASLPEISEGIHLPALLMGLLAIAVIFLFPMVTRRISSGFIALIAISILAFFIGYEKDMTIGPLASAWPSFQSEVFTGITSEIMLLALLPGFVMAVLGGIESVRSMDFVRKVGAESRNDNRDMIAQGGGNILSALFGGLAGSAAAGMNVLHFRNGGRTRLSAMIGALLILAAAAGLGSFINVIPVSVIAALLISMGVNLIDFNAFRSLSKFSKSEIVSFMLVVSLTVFADLMIAIGISTAIALYLMMKKDNMTAKSA